MQAKGQTQKTSSGAVSSTTSFTDLLKSKVFVQLLQVIRKVIAPFGELGISEEWLDETANEEATERTESVMKTTERYAIGRAQATITSPAILLKRISQIASQGLPPELLPEFLSPRDSLEAKVFDKHFEVIREAIMPFGKLGISKDGLERAAKTEAAELTERVMKNTEKFAIDRARKAKISPASLMKRISKIAGFDTGARIARQTRGITKKKKSK